MPSYLTDAAIQVMQETIDKLCPYLVNPAYGCWCKEDHMKVPMPAKEPKPEEPARDPDLGRPVGERMAAISAKYFEKFPGGEPHPYKEQTRK